MPDNNYKEELVSVLISVYNVEKYLKRCLESVLNGSYRNIEVICVDDGSTDSSSLILDEIAAQDSRVRVFHTENKGLPCARQLSLQAARGKYIAFIDSDDYVHRRFIEALAGNAVKYNADVVYCACRRVGDEPVCDSEKIADAVNNGIFFHDSYFRKYTWARVYRRDILKEPFFGHNENYQDALFNMSNVGDLQHPSIYYIETPMYYYYRRGDSLSNVPGQDERLLRTLRWIYDGRQETRNNLLYHQAFLWALSMRWVMLLQKDKAGAADMNMKLSFFLARLDHAPQISLGKKIAYHMMKQSPFLYETIRLVRDRSFVEWRRRVKKSAVSDGK